MERRDSDKKATWILFYKFEISSRSNRQTQFTFTVWISHTPIHQIDINVFASAHLKLSRMFLLLLHLSRYKRIFIVLATGGWMIDSVAVYSIQQKVITTRFFSRWICKVKNFSNRLSANDIDTMSDSVFRTSHSHTNASGQRNVNSYLCSSKICN